jgi:hypothetical protein
MADEKDAGKLAAELQALKADGKVLQRTLTVSAICRVSGNSNKLTLD